MAYEDLIQNIPLIGEVQKLGISIELAIMIVTAMIIWDWTWRGISTFKAARKDHKAWFVVLLLIPTWGILNILYVYVFSDLIDKFNESKQKNIKDFSKKEIKKEKPDKKPVKKKR